jgi:hypothetical protein
LPRDEVGLGGADQLVIALPFRPGIEPGNRLAGQLGHRLAVADQQSKRGRIGGGIIGHRLVRSCFPAGAALVEISRLAQLGGSFLAGRSECYVLPESRTETRDVHAEAERQRGEFAFGKIQLELGEQFRGLGGRLSGGQAKHGAMLQREIARISRQPLFRDVVGLEEFALALVSFGF